MSKTLKRNMTNILERGKRMEAVYQAAMRYVCTEHMDSTAVSDRYFDLENACKRMMSVLPAKERKGWRV